jgi:hypothetical protein
LEPVPKGLLVQPLAPAIKTPYFALLCLDVIAASRAAPRPVIASRPPSRTSKLAPLEQLVVGSARSLLPSTTRRTLDGFSRALEPRALGKRTTLGLGRMAAIAPSPPPPLALSFGMSFILNALHCTILGRRRAGWSILSPLGTRSKWVGMDKRTFGCEWNLSTRRA